MRLPGPVIGVPVTGRVMTAGLRSWAGRDATHPVDQTGNPGGARLGVAGAVRSGLTVAAGHHVIVDDATRVWVVHDTNPHALSPKVKKFVQAQHWFQDLTTIGLE